MLIERNENKKETLITTTKQTNSPKVLPKLQKENLLQFNTKDLLNRSSKLHEGELVIQPDDLRLIETNKISNDYLKKILSNELSKSPENLRKDFLSQHRFGWEIRARMVI